VLPKFAAADEKVEYRPDTPKDAGDGPNDFLHVVEITAAEQVDPHQYGRDWVEKDREQDLKQYFHTVSSR